MQTRRSVLLGGLATLSVPVLAACGGDDAPSPTTGAASGSASPGSSGPRVVTLDPFSTQDLFDLGLTPVGCQEGLETIVLPEYAAAYGAVEKIGSYDEPDLEKIAALGPDLIFASTGQQQFQSKLAQIARTVLVEGRDSTTWPQAAAQVADALDLTDRLGELTAAYAARAEEIKAAHADVLAATTWALVWRGEDSGFFVRPPDSNCGQVLALAGVRYGALTTSITDGQDVQLSWERAAELDDVDVLALPTLNDGSPDPASETIEASPLVQRLAAVEAGRVARFGHFTPGSYRNATALLDELDAFLATLG